MTLKQTLINSLEQLREATPLVHNITNQVVMNSTANTLLALGASPVMSDATEETADMVSIANSLVVNIGTLTKRTVMTMKSAVSHAGTVNTPWVLDPVGAAATRFRLDTSRLLLEYRPAVVRGNGSEIMALCGEHAGARGVDSLAVSSSLKQQAVQAAKHFKTVIAITGAVDIITDGERMISLFNGHPMMPRVTGTGCASSALIGAFLGVNEDPMVAAAAGLACMGIAGQLAAEHSRGPGSLQMNILDELYALTGDALEQHLVMEDIYWQQ